MVSSDSLYILGHPVAHSKSPAMQNAAYEALGLPWTYGFADRESEEEARRFILSGDWLGLNITMPYKPLAFSMAREATEDARVVQGANVLVRTPQGLRADNTDGRGAIAYLTRARVDFAGAAVVVCGTGPTAQAILHGTVMAGAATATLLGRDGAKAATILAAYESRLAKAPRAKLSAGSYDTNAAAIEGASIILDATPLGMSPTDGTPFGPSLLSCSQTVFDVVYGHGETPLLAAARALGCRVFNGEGMLVAQAVETIYDLIDWLDIPVDPRNVDLFSIMAKAADFDLMGR